MIGFEVIPYHLITRSTQHYFLHGSTVTSVSRHPHCRGNTITLRPTTFRRSPLEEWPACRRKPYLTNHNRNKRETCMNPAGFEPVIPMSERPQIHTLDGAATATS